MNGYRGFEGFGQEELVASPGILDSLGNALGSIIQTIGLQAPGMITGQPTSGYYPTTQPSAFGGIPPILLIGGGLALLWYLSKK